MSMRTVVAGLAALALAGVVVVVVQSSQVSPRGHVVIAARAAAATCDDKTHECLPKVTFVDTDNAVYPPEELTGKVVVVNFWATWCKPCKKEIPALSRVHDRYRGKGVVMLGVMTDDPDAQTLLNFASDHELVYPVVRATSELLTAFDYPAAIPTTFVFDRKGVRRVAHQGVISEAQLGDVVETLLADR